MKLKSLSFAFLFLLCQNLFAESEFTALLNKIIEQSAEDSKGALNALDSIHQLKKELDGTQCAKLYQTYGVIHYAEGHLQVSQDYFKKALKVENVQDPYLFGTLWNNLGVAYAAHGNYDGAIQSYQNSLRIREKLKDTTYMARTLMNLGNIYNRQGLYATAVEHYYRALPYFDQQDLKVEKATTLLNIGVSLHKMNEHIKAVNYIKEAHSIFKEVNNSLGQLTALNNLGSIQMDLEKYQAAQLSFDAMLKEAIQVKDSLSIAFAYMNLGNIARINMDWRSAGEQLKKAEKIFKRFQSTVNLLETQAYMAELAFATLDLKKGIAQMEGTYNQLRELEEMPLAIEIGDKYADMLTKNGQYKEAAAVYKEIGEYRNLEQSLQKKLIARDIEAKYQFEEQEKALELSSQKQQLLQTEKELQFQSFRNYVISLSLFIVLLFFVSLFLISRYRNQKRLLAQIEKANKAERNLIALKNNNLKAQLVNKNKELSRFAMHISESKQFLKDIGRQLKKAKNQEAIQQTYLRIIQHIQSDKESEELYEDVNQLMSTFRNTLQSQYEDLSEKDLRLCSLLQLRLSSKDIAAIFNISPKSVDMQRYRLRKKMNIPKNVSIDDWLDQIHSSPINRDSKY